jgi:hypothetical protein
MTAIAYRDGIIAADSGYFAGEFAGPFLNDKIVHIRQRRSYVAETGRCSDSEMFRHWLRNGADPENKPARIEDFHAMEVDHTGRLMLWDERLHPYSPGVVPFYAVGCGYEIAVGAMAAGASAREAVEICCKYNPGTIPPVHALSIDLL